MKPWIASIVTATLLTGCADFFQGRKFLQGNVTTDIYYKLVLIDAATREVIPGFEDIDEQSIDIVAFRSRPAILVYQADETQVESSEVQKDDGDVIAEAGEEVEIGTVADLFAASEQPLRTYAVSGILKLLTGEELIFLKVVQFIDSEDDDGFDF